MRQNIQVLKALLSNNGIIDRSEDPELWRWLANKDTASGSDLAEITDVFDINIVSYGDRFYMVPTQENKLFLKNNTDFRKDIRANNEVRNVDIFTMNYLSIYLIYIFYHGEGSDPRCRNFISKEDAIMEFSDHCRNCLNEQSDSEYAGEYFCMNFRLAAESWLQKKEGAPDSKKFDERYGMLNRLLCKFDKEHDDLFNQESGNIYPSRKLNDLIRYFLRKSRISEINKWIKEVDSVATND